jgi:hypothetical protein
VREAVLAGELGVTGTQFPAKIAGIAEVKDHFQIMKQGRRKGKPVVFAYCRFEEIAGTNTCAPNAINRFDDLVSLRVIMSGQDSGRASCLAVCGV